MSGYVIRAKRVDLSFPVIFLQQGKQNCGHCLNISESGLLANFESEAELWTEGTLQLSFAGTSIEVGARVSRCVEREAGMAFFFTSEAQREAVRKLITLTAAQSTLTGRAVPY